LLSHAQCDKTGASFVAENSGFNVRVSCKGEH
jgi:hypothetical protein